MKTYNIYFKKTGTLAASVTAGSLPEAFDKMAQSKGYSNHKNLMRAVKGYSLRDLVIKEETK